VHQTEVFPSFRSCLGDYEDIQLTHKLIFGVFSTFELRTATKEGFPLERRQLLNQGRVIAALDGGDGVRSHYINHKRQTD